MIEKLIAAYYGLGIIICIFGAVVLFACFLVRMCDGEDSSEKKFKKIYDKKKNESNFFLCDYCTKCKNKYSFTKKIDFFPYTETITKRTMNCNSPFDENDYVSSIKICNEFELDKNKV